MFAIKKQFLIAYAERWWSQASLKHLPPFKHHTSASENQPPRFADVQNLFYPVDLSFLGNVWGDFNYLRSQRDDLLR